MQPEIDYIKIGRRIKAARIEKRLSQSELGALVGCSNNHISHIEIGQTKVSLALLLKISFALNKNLEYFILDTAYASRESVIDSEIIEKLNQCDTATLVTISKIIDTLLDYQKMSVYDS